MNVKKQVASVTRNPLALIAFGVVTISTLDLFHLAMNRPFDPAAMTRLVLNAVFLVGFWRHSKWAWHVIVVIDLGIGPLTLVLDRYGPVRRSIDSSSILLWAICFLGILIYLWRIRDRYFQYIDALHGR